MATDPGLTVLTSRLLVRRLASQDCLTLLALVSRTVSLLLISPSTSPVPFPSLLPPSYTFLCHVTLVHFKNRIGDRRVGLGAARLSEMILADSGKTLQAGTAEETGEVCPCQQICHPH